MRRPGRSRVKSPDESRVHRWADAHAAARVAGVTCGATTAGGRTPTTAVGKVDYETATGEEVENRLPASRVRKVAAPIVRRVASLRSQTGIAGSSRGAQTLPIGTGQIAPIVVNLVAMTVHEFVAET